MADFILRRREGDVTTIALNRPESGNRVSDAMAAELAGMIDEASKDSRLILFKSLGDDFCLGRETMGQPRPALEAYELRRGVEVIFDLYDAFRRSKAPVIGAVQGRAVGFGCAVAALCDITIASEKARFQLPEMGHRIMPTIAMSALIDRVPRKALMYLVYSTDEIDAQIALSFGLVSQVVAPEALEGAVGGLIERLKRFPLPALLAVKEYARAAYGMSVQAATDFAKNLHATINSSSAMRS